MERKIIIGSRGSDLALWQANHVKRRIEEQGGEVEIKIIKTQGDKIQHLSFDKMEGKGFFTKEIEEALLKKEVDLAVHSHKDLETTNPEGLIVAAVSDREDPSELLLIRKESYSEEVSGEYPFKKGAVVGTSSARRKVQLLQFRPDIEIKDLRGNVPTRINKLRDGQYDAIVLAKAGVSRLKLDLSDLKVITLDKLQFIPAPAQGVLGLQIRETDQDLLEFLSFFNAKEVQECISIERGVLRKLDGGCQLPLGVYCVKENDRFKVWGMLSNDATSVPTRVYMEGDNIEQLSSDVLSALKEKKKGSFLEN